MDRSLRATEDALAFLYNPNDSDRRRLNAALALAALAHLGLFLIVWPHKPMESNPPPPERARFELTTPRVRVVEPPPPPPPPEVKPPRQRRSMPMPERPRVEPIAVEPVVLPPIVEPVSVPADAFVIPAPPPPAPPPAPPEIMRVGGRIEQPERLVFVKPRYTEMARKVRKGGLVILDTILAADGTVQDVTVLKSLPFGLTESAIDAVRQWRYKPTSIDGRPVPVRMTVSVRFSLQ